VKKRSKKQSSQAALFAVLIFATIGFRFSNSMESIQIFYERGAQLQDVWLDFSAVVTSAALVYPYRVINKHRKDRA